MLVLVADDDRAVREALERALQLAGYDVQLASDGDAALAAIAERTPDAVVLDVMMPGYDGLDVTRRLRREGNRVPVLLLTARDAVGDRCAGTPLTFEREGPNGSVPRAVRASIVPEKDARRARLRHR